MISGFVHCGKPKEAIGLFSEAEEAGVRPNEVMVVAVLAACADWGDLGLGSCKVFDGMKERTVVSWSAMIAGFAMHGQAEEALRLFSKMIQKGMDPNDVTFVGLLHASSHIGFVDQGREFFTSMTNDYGRAPSRGLRSSLSQTCLSSPILSYGELSLADAKFTKTLNWLKKQLSTFRNWIHLMMDTM
ncbi:hypothetical protein ACFX11_029260 [Malus domestica]